MATANGVSSVLVAKKQTTEGTKAGASGAQVYRRVTAEFNTEADKYSSNEIRVSQQQSDTRLGNFRTSGSIKGELSNGSYSGFIAAMLRKDFASVGATITGTTIGATITNTFTDSGNGFLTAGFKIGQIVRAAGLTATADNSKNLLVTNVTAGVLSVTPLNGVALTALSAGPSVTIAATGKASWVPTSGHTKDFFTVEIQETDASVYRTFIDQLVDKMDVNIQANGMTTIDFGFMGKLEDAVSGTAYFTAPTAQSGAGTFSGATSVLNVNGIATVVCTGMSLSMQGGVKIDPVVGSKYATAASRGKVMGSGQFTVFLTDSTYLEYFRNENELSIAYAMAASTAKDADAMAFCAPRIKITSATVNDGEDNKIVTCNYDMIEYTTAATKLPQTTLFVQDTTL